MTPLSLEGSLKCLVFALFLALCIGALNISLAQTNATKTKTNSTQRAPSQRPTQPPKPLPPSTATLTGKVFAITNGGDLKEARFASLSLLTGDSATQFKSTLLQVQAKVAAAEAKAQERPLAERNSGTLFDHDAIEFAEIRRKLTCANSFEEIAQKVVDLAKQDVLTKQDTLISAKTDEEGLFNVVGLKLGAYTVVAQGKAGANSAVWMEDVVVLENGKNSPLKMHSPVLACSTL